MGKDNERKLVDKTKKDTVSKSFWRDNEHFADLFNAVLFGGEQVVKPDNLEEMDTDVSGVIMADEFLSGIKKDDRFHPIINIILYYGEKEWDGPVSLKDMMVDMPERFVDLFADYQINLVQMLDSGRLLFHNEDVRILFDVVSNIYKKNIDYIYSKYDGTEVDGELFWMIGKITSNENMLEISREKKGESVVMCEAWREYYDEARRDGFKSGCEQGFKTATIEDIIFMIRYGISKKDLLKKYSEEDYNEALSKMAEK